MVWTSERFMHAYSHAERMRDKGAERIDRLEEEQPEKSLSEKGSVVYLCHDDGGIDLFDCEPCDEPQHYDPDECEALVEFLLKHFPKIRRKVFREARRGYTKG